MLPGLRERVMAVAMLLVVSLTMVVSASFAWITLSRAPEVTSVSTTVAANGNLEIALVDTDGVEPGESKVGDSSAAEGQSVTGANVTWGNLVNLSDPSYGLSNIVLRPALLSNASNLLNQPLKGADYGSDGRMELYYNEDFQFTNWVEPSNGVDGYFKYSATPQYGVRAISTVEYTYVNNTYYQFTQLMKVATGLQESVKTDYTSTKLVGNTAYINALAGLIGDFMTDKLNDKNGETDVSGYMEDVYNMMLAFEEIVYDFGDALVALANAQVYNKYMNTTDYPESANDPNFYVAYTYTRESFFAATTEELKANGVDTDSLKSYLAIQSKLQEVLYGTTTDTDDCIKDFYDRVAADRSATVKLSEIQKYINILVDINSCQIILADGTTYTVGGIGMSAATSLLGKDIDAKITKGLLKDFEQLSGCKMYATDVTVKATYIVTVSMKAKSIVTSAVSPYTYDTDAEETTTKAASNKGDYTAVAQDTYGMAIDLWVRTNADNSYLTLEGNVLTKTENVRETGVDMNGNVVELWTTTVTTTYTNDDGTTESVSSDAAVYQATTTTDGTSTTDWYYADNHSLLYKYDEEGNLPEGQTISTPIERYKEVVTVIGYEGENRVWDNNIFMDTSSTTQGSGSCYVFYADDPGQQENSLRLLSNLRVAFIDCNTDSGTYGKMVALGKLDIENAYEENGKVTLPLVLADDGSTYLTKTEEGLAILPLKKNTATRLTAIVYLDGREITNSDVLAANDIQGQLNIQFGSSVEMNPMSDEKLELATRSVTAVASKTNTSYPSDNAQSQLTFDYETDTDLTAYVRLAVDGEQPSKVTAFFMRKVNETQGSREGTFTLTYNEADGYYYGQYTFTAPGEYIMRTVQLDGVDYTLKRDDDTDSLDDFPSVKISGFSVEGVTVSYGSKLIDTSSYTIMTGDRSVSTNLSLKFATDQTRLPSSVRLQFLKDDGTQVTSTLTYDATNAKWNGVANFTSSGVYTLKYVIMDGEYTELAAQYQKELTLYMGMTVRIQDGGTKFHNVTWEGKSYSVPVYVDIYDDTGAEIQYLTGVKLFYTRSGSNVDGMNPDLKWDSTKGCYYGNLQIPGPGVYTFNSVMVGTSTLKSTTNTPATYTCVSPVPPAYYDAQQMVDLDDYLLDTGNSTYKVGVRLSDAEGATVWAVLYDSDSGKTIEVAATAENTTEGDTPISEFNFLIPDNSDGYQSGNWTITGLKLANVYDADSKFYYYNTDDEGNVIDDERMVMDLSQYASQLKVKIVNMKIEVKGDNEDLTGTFMESKNTTKPITIKVSDQNGEKLKFALSDISLQYVLSGTTYETYGGYTASHLGDQNGAGESDTYTITCGSDGVTYTLNSVKLTYAGVYEPYTMSFTVNGETYSYDRTGLQNLKVPKYTLTTTTPTVSITGRTDYSGSSTNGRTVTVVFKESTESSCGLTYYNYSHTSVTLGLAGIGKAASATLNFTESNGATVQLYTEKDSNGKTQNRVDGYTWSADGDCLRWVGYLNQVTGNDDITPAGTITATVLTLKDANGLEYTVDIEDIVIINKKP